MISNGIDVAAYTVPQDPGVLRKIGLYPEHTVILFLGRIHPVKGADRLLEAFFKVQQTFPEALLVMAGPDEFGLESSFRQRADASGLAQRVIFPGMVQGELKAQLLARANLFCLPSDAEGFSMAILEAMASSTAVLISPGCHFPEVESVGAGRVVGNDPDDLSTALSEMLSDPPALENMGRAGRQLVSTRFTWERITNKLLDAYAEGMDRYRASKHP